MLTDDVIQLLNDRKSGNKLQTQIVKISLSDESTSRTDIAFSAKIMKGLASFDASLNNTLKERNEFKLVSKLDF